MAFINEAVLKLKRITPITEEEKVRAEENARRQAEFEKKRKEEEEYKEHLVHLMHKQDRKDFKEMRDIQKVRSTAAD